MSIAVDPTQALDPFSQGVFSGANNPWAAFFGEPAHPYKTSSYDKYDRHNYNLPEAYIGKSKFMEETINELIYDAETWYTTVALPWNPTDDIHIQWDKWEFNQHFTGEVPEQGVSRLVSSHRDTRTESVVRRGLAANFEHGFMSTPQGRMQYVLTLRQIARAVQETANFGVLYAYLTCEDYNKQWQQKHGYFRQNVVKELLEKRKFMFAILQKEKYGGEKLDAKIVEWMNAYHGEADMWILPPAPAMYLRLVPEEKTDYYRAGQMGPDRVNNISGAGRPHENNNPGGENNPNKRLHDIVEPFAIFNKNKVYLTRTYHVDRTGPLDLMSRLTQIGEYNLLVDDMEDCDYRNYKSCYRSIRIYDETNDRGQTVSIKNAIAACNIFDGSEGKVRTDFISNNVLDDDLTQCFFLKPNGNNGGVTGIDIFGDINEQFVSAPTIINVGTTIAAAIGAGDDTLAQRINSEDENIKATARMQLYNGLKAICGGNDNLFLKTTSLKDGFDRFLENLLNSEMRLGEEINNNAAIGAALDMMKKVFREDANASLKSQLNEFVGRNAYVEARDFLLGLDDTTIAAQTVAESRAHLETWLDEVHKVCQQAREPSSSSSATARRNPNVGALHPDNMPLFQAIERARRQQQQRQRQPTSSIRQPISRQYTGLDDFGAPSDIGALPGFDSGRIGGDRADFDLEEGLFMQYAAADKTRNLGYLIQKIGASVGSQLDKICAIAYLGAPFSKDVLIGMCDNNILIPMGFLLARPHAQYRMGLGIKAKAGGDTGYTFFGHSDFQLSDDAATKMHYGHYTNYTKSIVMHPENVFIAYDIFSDGCMGGLGVRPYVFDGRSRTEYNPQAGRFGADLFVMALAYEERQFPADMDIAGRFYSFLDAGLIDNDEDFYRLQYSTAGYYNRMWKFHDRNRVGLDELDEPMARAARANNNRIISQGAQYSYNPHTNRFDRNIIVNQSPWGPDVYSGVKKVRDGTMRQIRHISPGEVAF